MWIPNQDAGWRSYPDRRGRSGKLWIGVSGDVDCIAFATMNPASEMIISL
jgi:hypothetical protein